MITATLPDFRSESDNVMFVITLIIPDAELQPVPIVMLFGKPWAGDTVTVAQAGKSLIGGLIPTGVDPEKLLSMAAWFKTFSASAFKLSDTTLSVPNSTVEEISEVEDEEEVFLSFLHEVSPNIKRTAVAIKRFYILIKLF